MPERLADHWLYDGRDDGMERPAFTKNPPELDLDRLVAAVVRANAVLNSYGIRGQLWHDLNAVLAPVMAGVLAEHDTTEAATQEGGRE